MARQIVVDIIGDSSKFNKATSGAINNANTLTGKLKGVGKGMVLGAGIGAFNLLSDGIGMAIGALGDMDKAFKEDQASQVLLKQALNNNIAAWDGNTKGVEAYATAQAKLGFQDDDVRASIGQLIGVTHDLSKAQELNTLAQELARAKGIDLAQATDIISKAAVGNGKALKGLGIDIAGATTATDLLDRVQQNVRGSAEAWAQTSEGKTAVSQVKVSEAMEKIGGIVDKVAQVVMPALADAFTMIADVVTAVWPTIAKIVEVAQKGIVTYIRAIITIVSTVISVFTGMASIITGVWNTITTAIKNSINTVIGIINGVIGFIDGIKLPAIKVGPVTVFEGWGGVNIPKIPKLHAGGLVPGAPGSDVLTMLQAGERVTPASQAGGNTVININIDRGAYIDGPSIDFLARTIAQRLNLVGIS